MYVTTSRFWSEEDQIGISSTPIILNVIPSKKITCNRGVRQGDPISPLLFVLAVELLQIVINEAWHNDGTKLPIDDLLVWDILLSNMPIPCYWTSSRISCIDSLNLLVLWLITTDPLLFLSTLSGQGCKTSSTPGLQNESMPFTYLGFPMGIYRRRVDDLYPWLPNWIRDTLALLLAMICWQISALESSYICSTYIYNVLYQSVIYYHQPF